MMTFGAPALAIVAAEPQPEKPSAANTTMNKVFDEYLAEKRNEHADRVCLHPDKIDYAMRIMRDLWGDMTVKEFGDRSRKRVKDAVEDWKRGDPENGRKPSAQNTCRKRIMILRTALRYAVKTEMIKRKHEPVFDIPAPGPPRERFVDPDTELPALLHAAENPRTAYHIKLKNELLLLLGCRVGALLALKWENVDFENRVIRLRDTQSATQRASNKKKREDQPMTDALFEILTEAKARATCEYVIEWRGKGISNSYVGQRALYKRAGITKPLHQHDLRRTSATYVHDELEGDIEKAAAHIGDTVAMAKRHYVHGEGVVRVKEAGINAVSEVMARARNSAKQS